MKQNTLLEQRIMLRDICFSRDRTWNDSHMIKINETKKSFIEKCMMVPSLN